MPIYHQNSKPTKGINSIQKISKLLYYLASIVVNSKVVQILIGIGILFTSAQLKINIGPVPITFQPEGILVIALLYPIQLSKIISLLYVLLGMVGVPLFAGYSKGISYLAGPTGGYLVGFVVATWVIASLRDRLGEDRWFLLLCYGFICKAIIYTLGIIWLTYLTSFSYAFKVGFIPFLPTAPFKALVVSSIMYQCKKIKIKDKSK